jgi:hypothetical protein
MFHERVIPDARILDTSPSDAMSLDYRVLAYYSTIIITPSAVSDILTLIMRIATPGGVMRLGKPANVRRYHTFNLFDFQY